MNSILPPRHQHGQRAEESEREEADPTSQQHKSRSCHEWRERCEQRDPGAALLMRRSRQLKSGATSTVRHSWGPVVLAQPADDLDAGLIRRLLLQFDSEQAVASLDRQVRYQVHITVADAGASVECPIVRAQISDNPPVISVGDLEVRPRQPGVSELDIGVHITTNGHARRRDYERSPLIRAGAHDQADLRAGELLGGDG